MSDARVRAMTVDEAHAKMHGIDNATHLDCGHAAFPCRYLPILEAVRLEGWQQGRTSAFSRIKARAEKL